MQVIVTTENVRKIIQTFLLFKIRTGDLIALCKVLGDEGIYVLNLQYRIVVSVGSSYLTYIENCNTNCHISTALIVSDTHRMLYRLSQTKR